MSVKTRFDWTVDELIEFETDIAREFEAGKIKAPIHLYSNNEQQMIDIFQHVDIDDWVLCTWRSHYQCLLKGVPADQVKAEIMAGRSISLCFPEYQVLSSAIVGGMLPIAVGIGMGLKRQNKKGRVWCFLGDMAAHTGAFHEARNYARANELKIQWVIEDNGLSVCTDTKEAWGKDFNLKRADDVWVYKYKNKYPHAGMGKRIEF